MKTNEAMKLLIDAYYGRADATDWSSVTIEPVDKGITSVEPTNCAYWKDQLSNVMSEAVITAKLHLVKPLGDVLKNLLDTTPSQWQKDLAGHFVTIGIRYVGIHARCGDVLGHQDDAVEIFSRVQVQVERYIPRAYDYKLKDMTSFVSKNVERMNALHLLPFLSYGEVYTHTYHKDPKTLESFLLPRDIYGQDTPSLPMNQALVSIFNSALSQDYGTLENCDHEPGRPFAQDLLKLCHTLIRLNINRGPIPGCQLMDLLLVSQTLTALAKAYTLADDPAAKDLCERGAAAMVDLTLKAQGQKIAKNSSVCRQTNLTKELMEPHMVRWLAEIISKELDDRPITASSLIESVALRFSRQTYLEVAFTGGKVFINSQQKDILTQLAETARSGLVSRSDFAPLGTTQKQWIAQESGDEKTKMAILASHPQLRKDAFINDLGL